MAFTQNFPHMVQECSSPLPLLAWMCPFRDFTPDLYRDDRKKLKCKKKLSHLIDDFARHAGVAERCHFLVDFQPCLDHKHCEGRACTLTEP